VDLRIERLADALDGLGPSLAQGGEEEPMRGGHTLVEVRVDGSGGEGPLESVDHGQEREQRRPPTLAAGNLLLACHPATEVVEVGEQPKIALALLLERATKRLDLIDLDRLIVGLRHVHRDARR
jgi:hypothetical protein